MVDKEWAFEQKIFALHSTGLAPSQIDEKLNLDPGTAHDIMVGHWRDDKTARMRVANGPFV